MLSTLSDRIRERLSAVNMTEAELARRVGISPVSIHNWAGGRTKTIKGQNLLAAAKALGCSPGWLATGIGVSATERDSADLAESREPAVSYELDPLISEAVELLRGLAPSARSDAVSFLRVFASKKLSGADRAGAQIPKPRAA